MEKYPKSFKFTVEKKDPIILEFLDNTEGTIDEYKKYLKDSFDEEESSHVYLSAASMFRDAMSSYVYYLFFPEDK